MSLNSVYDTINKKVASKWNNVPKCQDITLFLRPKPATTGIKMHHFFSFCLFSLKKSLSWFLHRWSERISSQSRATPRPNHKEKSIWAAASMLHPAWSCWAQHSASPSLRHDGSSQSTLQGVCVCGRGGGGGGWGGGGGGGFLRGGRIHVWGLCTGEYNNTKKITWSHSVDFVKRSKWNKMTDKLLHPPTQLSRWWRRLKDISETDSRQGHTNKPSVG